MGHFSLEGTKTTGSASTEGLTEYLIFFKYLSEQEPVSLNILINYTDFAHAE